MTTELPSNDADAESPSSEIPDSQDEVLDSPDEVQPLPTLSYLPEVDGLRAFAVMPVVLYHFNLGVQGGFAGVDVFFVISGFLITGILIADDAAGKRLTHFWLRRTRRIFPALAVMIVAVLFGVCTIGLRDMRVSVAKDTLAVLCFVGNFRFYSVMYGWSFSDLASAFNRTAAIMCTNGHTGLFEKPLDARGLAQLNHLDAWGTMDVIAWFEVWGGQWPHGIYPRDRFNFTLSLLMPRTRRLIIFGDTPIVPFGYPQNSHVALQGAILQTSKMQPNSDFAFLATVKEEKQLRDRRRANEAWIAAVARTTDRLDYFRVDHYFENEHTGDLQFVDPKAGTLVYKDFGHVNEDGAKRVEQLFRREVFGQPICTTNTTNTTNTAIVMN